MTVRTPPMEPMQPMDHLRATSRERMERWERATTRYVPVVQEDGTWRFSRAMRPHEPDQGWKLHVTATILTAVEVLEACAPYLHEQDILFKVSASLEMLRKLNSGLNHGFSQVGKFMTVYPANSRVALQAAAELDRLTAHLAGPPVPYDLPYRPGGCVYYRYGGFRPIEVVDENGHRGNAIRDPRGKLWTDRREPGHAVPEWILNPFPLHAETRSGASPLVSQFLVYDALSQRGKGGVYQAIDIRGTPARKCVVKEGRRHGETTLDGRDGHDLVRHEERVLRELRLAGVAVPEVLSAFELEGNRYLVVEFIEGNSLMSVCADPVRKLPLPTADALAADAAELLARCHATGWVWRDLKPFNLLLTTDNRLRPIDFEGAVRIDQPSAVVWGTPGYTPPELNKGPVTGSNLPEDLFALGSTLHQIYSSRVPVTPATNGEPRPLERRPLGVSRRGVHPRTREVVHALLDPDPRSRPTAVEAADELARRRPDASAVVVPRPRRRRIPVAGLQAVPQVEAIPGVRPIVLHKHAHNDVAAD